MFSDRIETRNGVDFSLSRCLALYRRASCYIAKQQYDQAKSDLDNLLTIEPENADANVREIVFLAVEMIEKTNESTLFLEDAHDDNSNDFKDKKCSYTDY